MYFLVRSTFEIYEQIFNFKWHYFELFLEMISKPFDSRLLLILFVMNIIAITSPWYDTVDAIRGFESRR